MQKMPKSDGVNLHGAIEKPALPESLLGLINLDRSSPATHQSEAFALTFALAADINQGLKTNEFEPLQATESAAPH